MATAKRPAALSRDVQDWSYRDRDDVYEYIDDLERELEACNKKNISEGG